MATCGGDFADYLHSVECFPYSTCRLNVRALVPPTHCRAAPSQTLGDDSQTKSQMIGGVMFGARIAYPTFGSDPRISFCQKSDLRTREMLFQRVVLGGGEEEVLRLTPLAPADGLFVFPFH